MSLQALLAAQGAFASRQPIPKTVCLPTDSGDVEATVYFLDLPHPDVRRVISSDAEDREARFLVMAMCNADGTPVFELEGPHGALALKFAHHQVLVKAGLDALGFTKSSKDEAKKD